MNKAKSEYQEKIKKNPQIFETVKPENKMMSKTKNTFKKIKVCTIIYKLFMKGKPLILSLKVECQ